MIVSSVGVNSGIDYGALIKNLIEVERQPLVKLQARQQTYNDKVSAYGTLSTKVSALKTAADALRTATNFYAKKVSVTDTTVVDATVTNSAVAGTYQITNITALAQAQQITHTSAGLTNPDTGTVLATGSTFQFTINGETKTVTAASNLTLNQLATQINSQTYTGNVKVAASVVNTGTVGAPAYKLVLASDTTGAANTITINQDQSTLGFLTTGTTTIQAAQNASFQVNGLQLTRSSNTVSDAISGVTFTLKKASAGTPPSANLVVTNDTDTMTKNIQAFVNAYNDVVSYIKTNSTYDTKTNIGGSFNADSTARNIMIKLQSISRSSVAGQPADLSTLSQAGVTANRDNTLSINSTTLNSMLSTRVTDVANLFTNATAGIAKQFYDYANTVTDSISGDITVRVNGLKSNIDRISTDITKYQNRLDKMQGRLQIQFSNLEALLGSLQTQGNALTRAAASWTK